MKRDNGQQSYSALCLIMLKRCFQFDFSEIFIINEHSYENQIIQCVLPLTLTRFELGIYYSGPTAISSMQFFQKSFCEMNVY